jgi:hypothetical protein
MLDRQALQTRSAVSAASERTIRFDPDAYEGSAACTSLRNARSDEPLVVTHFRKRGSSENQEPRHILVVCRSEMITASLSELLADHGYGVTGVVASDRGRQIIEARPVALLVLAGKGDAVDMELVRTARRRGIAILVLALSSGGLTNWVVDGQPVLGVSRGTLIATVHSMIGGPIDSGPVDPLPRAA